MTLAQALDMVSTSPEGAAIFLRYLVNLFGDASELGIAFEGAADRLAPAPLVEPGA
jgi:hypothetical protein